MAAKAKKSKPDRPRKAQPRQAGASADMAEIAVHRLATTGRWDDAFWADFKLASDQLPAATGYWDDLSVAHLKFALDHLPAMVGYWDASLHNRFANRAYQTWFGLNADTIRGKHVREVIGECHYAANLPYIEAALSGQPQVFECDILVPDGSGVRCSLAHYIPDVVDGKVIGFFVLVTDVTPLKEANEALNRESAWLRERAERYRAVVQDQMEIISRLRADGTYLFANEVFCRFFGVNLNDLLGATWQPLVHPDDLAHVGEALSRLSVDCPVVMIENRVYDAEGKLHWMQFSNRGIFDAQGALVEIQSVGRDITDRKIAEENLARTHDELRLRVQQLRQLSVESTLMEARERREIASDLHDDLGQTLHVMKIKIDMLAKQLAPEQRPMASELQTLVSDASRAVRSLTSQISPPVLKDLGLIPALHWLADQMARQMDFLVSVESDVEGVTMDDVQSTLVFRAVRELLINAVKHSGCQRARLALRGGEQELIIRVSDEGVGMDEAASVGNAANRFGLTSVRDRIHFLGGRVLVCSSPDHGTVVEIQMPLAAAGVAP